MRNLIDTGGSFLWLEVVGGWFNRHRFLALLSAHCSRTGASKTSRVFLGFNRIFQPVRSAEALQRVYVMEFMGIFMLAANFVLRKRPVSPNAQRFSTRQLLEYRKSREKRSSLPEANRAIELVAQSLLVCWRENPRSIYGKRNDWRSMCRE